ncbi:uncharacterized protein FFB20_10441 [Fusarium fujikuroi]|uniref:C2H2-type domain-containing protein n=1 Tax=Gibberella fujikuroi (strain CBS 195.34 / IMI 58289 / NRRL A-6831) TaxID=1279085 RepID=S0EB69_GIBF5|nr:uncharacterized protein FFUJ_13876 [Fusarium fujikuroi IMI 58289]QGI67766.1 hypothetical protein CEK27_011737 [Fusarium fujikuroi]QGI98651.1 hypothetical protein CEK26_011720 [Fusarium fujikuroi]CCT72124.1 uncharacterized protein FFUJ_13876 [Fusarium fujikuroi IMI 58289]SCN97600.1 uncharacterized protein FFB20_10441 [Fusarium fujikuroi]SCO11112.1 uncharacterized protein FFC1_11385 [Fusarium fujikuroi]
MVGKYRVVVSSHDRAMRAIWFSGWRKDMLLRCCHADSVAPSPQRDENIHLGSDHIETVKSVGLIDRNSKQTEKDGHRQARSSIRNVAKGKEKGLSSLGTRALEYRTTKDIKPRPPVPKNQVQFIDDQKNDSPERQARRLLSPGEASSRRTSLPNNLLPSAEKSCSVASYSPDYGIAQNVFPGGLTGAHLHSDANHTPRQEKKGNEQKFPPSGARTSGKSTKRPAESSSIPHKKSRRAKSHNDLEEADGDDDDRHGSGEDKKEEKFACPFYRKDPVRFLECMNLRLVSISIVKQHLKRRHAASPGPDSSGYQESFALSTVSRNHITKASHAQGKAEDIDSIPPDKLEALKLRSDRRISSTDQWHEIWVLLFGESDITPKPLLDGVVKEMTGIIRDIWSKDGNQIVLKHIQAQGFPRAPHELLSLLPDFLDAVEDRFEKKPVGVNVNQQIAVTQEPASKTMTKRLGDRHQSSLNPFKTPYYMPEMSIYTPISPSASFMRDSSTPIFGVEEDFEDPFRVLHHMAPFPNYNPVLPSASLPRHISPTPIFDIENSDDRLQIPYHMSHLSNYTHVPTSAFLTRDFPTSTFDVENSDDLQPVGGVLDSQGIPCAYPYYLPSIPGTDQL